MSLANEIADKMFPVLGGVKANPRGNVMEQFAAINNATRKAIIEAVDEALERAALEADGFVGPYRNDQVVTATKIAAAIRALKGNRDLL